MLAAGLFDVFASPLAWFYHITNNYILAISAMALIVMVITAPLVLKSTKGMLEMQKLQPEMRRLQQVHRGDRQTLNAEMMKLYQEHKVNPLASCFPLLLQLPVFFIMFRVLYGLTNKVNGGFEPKYIAHDSQLYRSLQGKNQMLTWGLDLSKTPKEMIADGIGKGWIYALLVVVLGVLYFAQQKMVAARATAAPTMSPTQQKIMQYLPVVFAVFLVFYLTGLVIYYMAQAVFRIGLQYYITHRFYKGEASLGRQAMAASERARELAKKDGSKGGLFAQAREELASQRGAAKGQSGRAQPAKGASGKPAATTSKRVTAPKNKPTSAGGGRPQSSGKASRPNSRQSNKKK